MKSKITSVLVNTNYDRIRISNTIILHPKNLNPAKSATGVFQLVDKENKVFAIIRCVSDNNGCLYSSIVRNIIKKFYMRKNVLILKQIPIRTHTINRQVYLAAKRLIDEGYDCLTSIGTWSYKL